MKKIINFLRKVGLLHIGVGDYYNGEFDDRKDIKKKDAKKSKSFWILWILIFFGVVSLLFSLMMLGFSFWFFIVFVLWFWFAFFIRKTFKLGFIIFKPVIMFFFSVFIVTFIISLVFVSGDINTDSDDNYNICKASFLKNKPNDRVKIKITDNNDIFQDMTKSSYSLVELDSLGYGFDIKQDKAGEYVLVEICDGDISISHTDLDMNDTVLYQDDSEFPSTGGNYTHFSNEQPDGSFYRDINEAGKYQIYVYLSRDGEKWVTAREFDIEVK